MRGREALLVRCAALALAGVLLACGRPAASETLEFSFFGVQVGLAEVSGDCDASGLALRNIRYAGPTLGQVRGRAEMTLAVLQSEDSCRRGRAAGAWLVEAEGDLLLGAIEATFTVDLGAGVPPPWAARDSRLRITGGAGAYEGARGTGTCEARGTVAAAPGQRGAIEARCRLSVTRR